MKNIQTLLATLLALICLLSTAAEVNDASMSDETTEDWPAYGCTHKEQRYSPLTQINTNNVSKLKVDWYLQADLESAGGTGL